MSGRETFGDLPPFMADSQLVHWRNKALNEWAKAHNINTRKLAVPDRPAYIGRKDVCGTIHINFFLSL
jgi:hypothetical protein